MKQNFTVRKGVYLISIIFLLGLPLFMVTKQFMADVYWRMTQQNGKEPNEIIDYLKKSVAIDGKNALFHFSLGRAFLQKGLADTKTLRERNKWVRKSTDEFHRAIELEPSHSDYHFHLGISYGLFAYPPSFYRRVIQESFKRTVMLNPNDTRHLYSIGIYYLNEYDRLKNITFNIMASRSLDHENHKEHLRNNYQLYFKKLLDVNEEYLGKILKKCFSVTQSYEDLKAVIRDTPYDHVSLARFLKNRKMWKDAEQEFLAAINLDPTDSSLYFDFAYSYFERREFENAIKWWQKQKRANAKGKTAYLYLADTYQRLNRFDDAARELRTLTNLYPENTSFKIKLIRIFMAADQLHEAINEYQQFIGKDLNFSKEVYDSLCYHKQRGNYKEVARILKKDLSSANQR